MTDLQQAVERVKRVREAMSTHVLHFALRAVYGRSAPNRKFEDDLRLILSALPLEAEKGEEGSSVVSVQAAPDGANETPRYLPLLAGRRANHPIRDEPGKRIVGFVVDEEVAGLSDALSMLRALVEAATGIGGTVSQSEAKPSACTPATDEQKETPPPSTEGAGELREKVARLIYDELEGPVADQDFGRQSRQWNMCVALADQILALLPAPPPSDTMPEGKGEG